MKTVATILATLAVTTSVLSAPTKADVDRALQLLRAFNKSLHAWNTRPNCLGDKECAFKEVALLDQLVRDGDQYLGQSPVLLASLWDTKAASGISDAEITKQAAVFQGCDHVAVMAKRYADALHGFMNSHNVNEMEDRKKATVIARVDFEQALKEVAAIAREPNDQ